MKRHFDTQLTLAVNKCGKKVWSDEISELQDGNKFQAWANGDNGHFETVNKAIKSG